MPLLDSRVSASLDAARSERVEGSTGRLLIPFIGCTLIWSSTWLVIRTQLGIVPPAWSVAYRFLIAAAAMMAYARLSRAPLRLSARQQAFAALYGIAQYALNYDCVYLAERSITSGLVAVLFALLVVPNALLGWLFLGQRVTARFLIGSAVALLGIALLFAHEAHGPVASHAAVLAGIGWALAGVLFSSIANVMQGSRRARAIAVPSLIAWGMAWGVLFDCLGAWAVEGPPVIDPSAGYWLGTAYLGLIGSGVAFTFYFHVIRAMGPARAAYTSVLTPVLAMALSTGFEGYRWTVQAAAGGALSLAGLVVALRARQAAKPAR